MLTNKQPEELSIEDAMLAHKKQYKSEHAYRRAKGPLSIEPIYLHTPERIEVLLLLFKMALQMVVLIERTARKTSAKGTEALAGLCPTEKMSVIQEASTCSKSSKTSSVAVCLLLMGRLTVLYPNLPHYSAKSKVYVSEKKYLKSVTTKRQQK